MICPSCQGTTKIFGRFPPISIACETCQATGTVDENYLIRLDEGKKLKVIRIRSGLSLREYCLKYNLNPVERSQKERGILSGISN